MTETVDVLLATFNGARFLPQQLGSIETQTYSDWRLIVRDDGSSDGTLEILEAFAQRHPGRVRVLRDGRGRLGACGNFGALLEASDAPYFMFCDQDDVWLPEKIAALLGTMREAEKKERADTPILVHSDLVVVDEELRLLNRSFWRYTRLFDPSALYRPARLAVQNFVTGCASAGNAALRDAALPMPSEARVHDWWVALVAAILGRLVEHVPATVLYRQHRANEIGANPGHLYGITLQLFSAPLGEISRGRFGVIRSQRQAAAFLNAYATKIDPTIYQSLSDFSRLQKATFWQRKSFLARHGLWPDYWLRKITLLLFL